MLTATFVVGHMWQIDDLACLWHSSQGGAQGEVRTNATLRNQTLAICLESWT